MVKTTSSLSLLCILAFLLFPTLLAFEFSEDKQVYHEVGYHDNKADENATKTIESNLAARDDFKDFEAVCSLPLLLNLSLLTPGLVGSAE